LQHELYNGAEAEQASQTAFQLEDLLGKLDAERFEGMKDPKALVSAISSAYGLGKENADLDQTAQHTVTGADIRKTMEGWLGAENGRRPHSYDGKAARDLQYDLDRLLTYVAVELKGGILPRDLEKTLTLPPRRAALQRHKIAAKNYLVTKAQAAGQGLRRTGQKIAASVKWENWKLSKDNYPYFAAAIEDSTGSLCDMGMRRFGHYTGAVISALIYASADCNAHPAHVNFWGRMLVGFAFPLAAFRGLAIVAPWSTNKEDPTWIRKNYRLHTLPLKTGMALAIGMAALNYVKSADQQNSISALKDLTTYLQDSTKSMRNLEAQRLSVLQNHQKLLDQYGGKQRMTITFAEAGEAVGTLRNWQGSFYSGFVAMPIPASKDRLDHVGNFKLTLSYDKAQGEDHPNNLKYDSIASCLKEETPHLWRRNSNLLDQASETSLGRLEDAHNEIWRAIPDLRRMAGNALSPVDSKRLDDAVKNWKAVDKDYNDRVFQPAKAQKQQIDSYLNGMALAQ